MSSKRQTSRCAGTGHVAKLPISSLLLVLDQSKNGESTKRLVASVLENNKPESERTKRDTPTTNGTARRTARCSFIQNRNWTTNRKKCELERVHSIPVQHC